MTESTFNKITQGNVQSGDEDLIQPIAEWLRQEGWREWALNPTIDSAEHFWQQRVGLIEGIEEPVYLNLYSYNKRRFDPGFTEKNPWTFELKATVTFPDGHHLRLCAYTIRADSLQTVLPGQVEKLLIALNACAGMANATKDKA